MKETFTKIKDRVKKLTEENKHREVTAKTSYHNAGVYMFYVDCFDDSYIIPFYIGKTTDFQRRHSQHFKEILSLNRLDFSCYKYALINGLYHGHYKACKIFSYMVNHKCSLKDLHMVILEEIENEEEQLCCEQNYINDLCAPFFGFNQINSVQKHIESNGNEIFYKNTVREDLVQILKHSNYGYNFFNWYITSGIFQEIIKDSSISLDSEKFEQIYTMKKLQNKATLNIIELKAYINYGCRNEMWDVCKDDIKNYFLENGLKSEDKQKLIIDVLLFDFLFDFEKERKTLLNYFNRYAKSSSKIFDILNTKHSDFISKTKTKIELVQKIRNRLEYEKTQLQEKNFSALLPSVNYTSHPLKSLYDGYQFPITDTEDNICYINIEYTCFKRNSGKNLYPKICKIDYQLKKNNITYSKESFIKNPVASFWETDNLYYYEKGFHYGPFNVELVRNTPKLSNDIDTYFSVSMEYNSGLNEFDFIDAFLEDEVDVFKEIDALIDDKTKIVYTSSGYKNTIKNWSDLGEKENIEIIKRLIKACKSR